MDLLVLLKVLGSLDTLPGGSDLDENALAVNAEGLVEGNELLGLLDGALGVEGEAGVDLSRDTARDELKNGLAELNELKRATKERKNIRSVEGAIGQPGRQNIRDGSWCAQSARPCCWTAPCHT